MVQPSTPQIAGWYPDPLTDGRFRYWDGASWTDDTHPISGRRNEQPQPRESTPTASADASRAWLLAAIPLLAVIINLALLLYGNADALILGVVAAVIATFAVAEWDSRHLKSEGLNVPTHAMMFMVPVYLYERSRQLRQPQWLLIAWIASLCVAIAGDAVLANRFVNLNMSSVRSDIVADVQARTSTLAQVNCPSKQVRPVGSTFICDVLTGATTLEAKVHIENASGDITWIYLR
jgi:hypothetical protein